MTQEEEKAGPLFRISPDVVAREIRGELFVLPLRSTSASLDGFYSLNRTAADIWRGLEEGLNVRQIAERIAASYEVSAEEAAADVRRTLRELEAAGLIAPLDAGR